MMGATVMPLRGGLIMPCIYDKVLSLLGGVTLSVFEPGRLWGNLVAKKRYDRSFKQRVQVPFFQVSRLHVCSKSVTHW